ncbi:hypothetical protein MMC07_009679 [Pseudocyphellaria aurata]|nr:hypothetical protein [Pseudocyphellaria aurata]
MSNMCEMQWPKLENFIPNDILELTRLLRTNFTKINHFVGENPVGRVPNYYFNVLSQQFMVLSEKLLAPPSEGELTALERMRAQVAAQLTGGLQGNEQEEEAGRTKVVQDGEWHRAEDESAPKREKDMDDPSFDKISNPSQEDGAEFSNPHLVVSQPRWGNAGGRHATRAQSGELQIASIPFNVDLQDDADREIRVAIPALACSTSTGASKILLESYGVEMQNIQTISMSIKTEAQKVFARKRLIDENSDRNLALRDTEDIVSIEWINNEASEKLQSALVLGFRTPELANEAIEVGLEWHGSRHSCRKYLRNCKQRQCVICQGYGHGESQCTSPPRCIICSGQHSPSQCASRVLICALCGGDHSATSTLCPVLAAEKTRVRNAQLNPEPFWPANSALERAVETRSFADGPLSAGVQHTVLTDPTCYEEIESQSKTIWPLESCDQSTSRTWTVIRVKSPPCPPPEPAEEQPNTTPTSDPPTLTDMIRSWTFRRATASRQ